MKTLYTAMILLFVFLTSNCLANATSSNTADFSNHTRTQQLSSVRQDVKMHTPVIPLFFSDWAASSSKDLPLNPGSTNPNDRPSISILANGSAITTINVGQDIVLTVTFSTGINTAEFTTLIDMNANNTYEQNVDIITDDPMTLVDNDMYDENPAVGVYQGTMTGDDGGPSTVANIHVLFRVVDTGGSDVAAVHVLPVVTNYSVAGTVTPAMSTLIVMANPTEGGDGTYLTTTNANGTYILYVPEAVTYNVMCFDPLNLTGGLISMTTYDDLLINAHLTGYNFVFVEPSSSISGYVRDQSNVPVSNISVYVYPEDSGSEYMGITDQDGYYHVGLGSGSWHMNINTNPDFNNYLQMSEYSFTIAEDQDLTHDFVVYETDGVIQGSTYVEGQLASQIPVRGDCGYGTTYTNSNANGNYTLKVSTLANATGGNNLYVPSWDLPENMYCTDFYSNVLSGASDINFNVHIATGGIEGYIYNQSTGQPVDGDAWVSAYNNNSNFNAGVNNDGFYHLSLPAGTYTVNAGGNQYYNSSSQTITVGTGIITVNFVVVPIIFTGSIYGYVYNTQTTTPLSGVGISISMMNFGQYVMSDATGYYSVQVPNGTFTLDANAPNYMSVHTENLVVMNNNLLHNVNMTPIGVDDPIIPVSKLSMMNFPNPFNPETTVQYSLPAAMHVKLEILNIRGQLVKTLYNGQGAPGVNSITWNGRDNDDMQVASGVYLYRITTPVKTITNKMLMVK